MKPRSKPRRRRARPLLALGATVVLGGITAAGCDDSIPTGNAFVVFDLSVPDAPAADLRQKD